MARKDEDSIENEEAPAGEQVAVPEDQGDEEIDDMDEDGIENGSGDKDADDEEGGEPESGDEDDDGGADEVWDGSMDASVLGTDYS